MAKMKIKKESMNSTAIIHEAISLEASYSNSVIFVYPTPLTGAAGQFIFRDAHSKIEVL